MFSEATCSDPRPTDLPSISMYTPTPSLWREEEGHQQSQKEQSQVSPQEDGVPRITRPNSHTHRCHTPTNHTPTSHTPTPTLTPTPIPTPASIYTPTYTPPTCQTHRYRTYQTTHAQKAPSLYTISTCWNNLGSSRLENCEGRLWILSNE